MSMNQRLSEVALPHTETCSRAAEPHQRSVLVTDLEEFTNLLDRTDDQYGRIVIREHNRILRGCLREYQGTESAHTGDGVIASFGNVDGALSCAIAIQRALELHNRVGLLEPLHVRIGLHVGQPLMDDDRLFGKCVNTAVRLCTNARPGRIVVSQAVVNSLGPTRFRFAALGARHLKGLSNPLVLYELEWNTETC
jgi:class 3 adenylate cyclase